MSFVQIPNYNISVSTFLGNSVQECAFDNKYLSEMSSFSRYRHTAFLQLNYGHDGIRETKNTNH